MDNTVLIKKEKLYKAHKEVLLNREAFIFIMTGYLLGLFGSSDGVNRWAGFAVVFVTSVVLVFIGLFVAHLIAKICNKVDRRYDYMDLCSIIDEEVDTNMINSDIDELN